MRFDVVVTNPPFQDRAGRGQTSHKLWLDFTDAAFARFLRGGGTLLQVSPASFGSPSSRALHHLKRQRTTLLRFDIAHHFPAVASTFAHYTVVNDLNSGAPTTVETRAGSYEIALDESVLYLPTDMHAPEALSIHRKVMFAPTEKLPVKHDYVTCHNQKRRVGIVSPTRSDTHVHPVLHTNRQTWWSSARQQWADLPKVMWSSSGHTRPFFDDGVLGGTDLAHYVLVPGPDDGQNLAQALNSALFRYIFATAKWSGFGNDRVFQALPSLPTGAPISDDDLFALFGLTGREVNHVRETVGPGH